MLHENDKAKSIFYNLSLIYLQSEERTVFRSLKFLEHQRHPLKQRNNVIITVFI